MKENKIPSYRFLDRDEVLNIIKTIDKVKDFDTKSRLYLVTLKYKSVEIQNFTIKEAEELIESGNIPDKIKKAIRNSLTRRKISIEANDLKEDTKYLFVNSENKKIHDCLLLREWRTLLKENNIEEISTHVFKQSINFIQWKEYWKEIQQNKDKNVSLTDIRHSCSSIVTEDYYVK